MQSESPSASKLNDLGVYQLVSLFFVVAALMEFAFVLLIQRKLISNFGCNNNTNNRQNRREKQKISNLTQTKGNVKHVSNIIEVSPEQIHVEEVSNDKTVISGSTQLSTERIDMMACILFVLFYLLFNLFYWV